MQTVQCFIDQQLGFSKWRSYDHAMRRLRCSEKEEYNQIFYDELAQADSPIFACKFANKEGYEHILALANEDGKLAIHDTSNKEERLGQQVHNNAVFDLAWMFSQMKLVTVSGDHTARLVNISDSDVRVEHVFTGHTRSIKSIAVKQNDSSVFATGGRDGNILVWDVRSSLSHDFVGHPDRTICNAHYLPKTTKPCVTPKRRFQSTHVSGLNSVTGLAFQDEYTLVSCSAGEGTIKVWDVRKSYKSSKEPCPKSTLQYSGNTARCGFSSLMFDKDCVKLYVNCLDHVIYCYNMATYNPEPIMKYVGHQNNSFYVKSCLSGDGLYLLSGSCDKNAYIWRTDFAEPIVTLKGHNLEVTCVAWCQNLEPTIVTCSDDMRHKIWRIGPDMLPDNWEVIGRGIAEPFASTSTKRFQEADGSSNPSKKMSHSCVDEDDVKFRFSCSYSPGSHKRVRSRLDESENKRLRTDNGSKRLFQAVEEEHEEARPSSAKILVRMLEEDEVDRIRLKKLKINSFDDTTAPADEELSEIDHRESKVQEEGRLSETFEFKPSKSDFMRHEVTYDDKSSMGKQESTLQEKEERLKLESFEFELTENSLTSHELSNEEKTSVAYEESTFQEERPTGQIFRPTGNSSARHESKLQEIPCSVSTHEEINARENKMPVFAHSNILCNDRLSGNASASPSGSCVQEGANSRNASNNKLFDVKTPKSSLRNTRHGSPDFGTCSPTSNLPNFVMDGCAPHLHYSPPKRSDRDWLTKLHVERCLFQKMRESDAGPSPSKIPKVNNSPKVRSAKKQNRSVRGGSSQTHLLKFFRVTNNSIMKDCQGVSKASLSRKQS